MKIENLTPENILNGEIPMDNLLRDSLYYPACLTDDRNIKYFTERMMDYLRSAYWLLPDTKESWCTEEMTQKRQVCERLIKHLEMFCTKI